MKRESSFDVLSRIEELRADRGWSVLRLAQEAGIPVSTLNNLYLRASTPSIGTLENICTTFGIQLSEFFSKKNRIEITAPAEIKLIRNYRSASEKERKAVSAFLDCLNN